MTRVRITALLIGLLILNPTVIKAQDSTSQLTPTNAQTDEEIQKQQEALEHKATILLEQIVGAVPLLRLPENRIRVQTEAGDLLWQRNEGSARSMFLLAADGVAEMMRSADGNVQRGAFQLRQEVVLTAAQHDAALAYQLLATTRSLTPIALTPGARDWNTRFRGQNSDANLEENLLARVSALDPKLAAQKVEESLAKGQYPNTIAQVGGRAGVPGQRGSLQAHRKSSQQVAVGEHARQCAGRDARVESSASRTTAGAECDERCAGSRD